MIHYHGLPITPGTAALAAVQAGHAFISYEHPSQLGTAVVACQSFALDNGAFTAWKAGRPVKNWSGYYEWARESLRLPSCDFAVIPDVIDGSEADNDTLLAEWPLPQWFGTPVWHMHESLERLERMAGDGWVRLAIGSSGEYATVGSRSWWMRMSQAMRVVCDDMGRPGIRLHGLRMLDPSVFSRLPFASADSTNIGRNVGIDKAWGGPYSPPTKEARAQVMRSRIEAFNAPAQWAFSVPTEQGALW